MQKEENGRGGLMSHANVAKGQVKSNSHGEKNAWGEKGKLRSRNKRESKCLTKG